jgi:alpha-glucoside transport system substrate-binding protein
LRIRNRARRFQRAALTGTSVLLLLGTSGCFLQNPETSGSAGPGGQTLANGGSSDGDKKVTILGQFGGDEGKNFVASLTAFEKSSGIKIQYTSDTDFATTIKTRVSAGDTPDIALFPQPGGLLEMAQKGVIQPLDTYLDFDSLNRSVIPGFLDAARLNGRYYGVPVKMAVKGLVWYPKKAYDAAGYSTDPKTTDDLTAITDRIKASGISPWCMAWGSDQATGWVGTDWIEDFVIRMYGPDVYDDWVSHRIPFNDPRIIKAFDAFGKIAKAPGEVYGGVKGVLNTPFANAMTPAFSKPPKCMLHHQADFAITFYPKKVQADLDNQVGLFVLPQVKGGYAGQPIIGGGDMAGLMNGDDPDAIKVMKFLASKDFGKEWAAKGGWISPHRDFDASVYPNETTKRIAQIAANADVLRFDGSDLMPKEVGSGTFWTGMVAWLQGKSSKAVTTEIENSWPAAKSGS